MIYPTLPVVNGQVVELKYFHEATLTLRQQTLACLDSYLKCVGGIGNVVIGDMGKSVAAIGQEAHKQFFLPMVTMPSPGSGLFLTTKLVPKNETPAILAEKGPSASRFGSGVHKQIMAKMATGFIVEADSFPSADDCAAAQLHFTQTYLGGAAAWITKTGGKGSHFAVGYSTPVHQFEMDGLTETAAWKAHVRCYRLAIAVLRADVASLQSLDRKLMRVPGVAVFGRNQALVYHNDVQVTPFQLQAALEAAALAVGLQITDEALAGYEAISIAEHDFSVAVKKLDPGVDRALFRALSDELLTFNGSPTALNQAAQFTLEFSNAARVKKAAETDSFQVDPTVLIAANRVLSREALCADNALVATWCAEHGAIQPAAGHIHHDASHIQCAHNTGAGNIPWITTPVPVDQLIPVYGSSTSAITLGTVVENNIATGTKLVCPHCGRDAKLFIRENDTGAPGTPEIFCWHATCHRRFVKQEIYQVESVAPSNGDGTYYNQSYLGKTWNEIKYSTTKYLDPASVSADRYLTALLAGCGAGKSTLIRSFTAGQKATNPDTTVVIPGHRISLVRSLQRIGEPYGMKCYLDYPEGTPIPFTDMAVTLDSLRRIQMPIGGHNGRLILVLDEVEALLQHTMADTLLSRQSVEDTVALLRAWLAAADKVIISDANLSAASLHALWLLLPEDRKNDCELVLNNGGPIHHVRTVELADASPDGLKQQKQQLHDDLADGKCILHLNDTKATPTSAKEVLAVEFPDKKLALVTSETSESVREHLFNADQWVKTEHFDYLGASPSLESGVSIEGHFDRIYVEATGRSDAWGVQEVIQAMQRERSPKDNLIRLYVTPTQRADLPITLDGCRNALLYKATEEAARLPNFLPTYTNGYWMPKCPLTFEFMACVMLQRNLNRSNTREALAAQMINMGWNVTLVEKPADPVTEFADECKAQAKEDKQQEIDEFVAAEPLLRDWSPVDEILGIEPFAGNMALDVETAELVMRTSGATKQQKDQARKTKVLDLVPREFLDPNNEANVLKAAVHGKGRLRETIKTASLFLAYLFNAGAEYGAAVGRQAKKLKETSHVKPLFTKAQSVHQILTAFTITEETERYKLEENAGTSKQVAAAIGALRRVGLKVNGGSRGAVGTIQDALKLCGFKLTIERDNTDKAKPITGIYLDKSTIQNLQALTSIYRRRLVGVQTWSFETINLAAA